MDDSAQNRPHSRMPLVPRWKNCQPADGTELLNINNIAGEFNQKQIAPTGQEARYSPSESDFQDPA